jgi:hypothetical protein
VELKSLRLLIRMLLPLLLAGIGPPLAAAAEPKTSLEACATERDDRRRLACYDAEVARLARPKTAAAGGESDDSTEVASAKSRRAGQQSGGDADDFGMTAALARSMKQKGEERSEEPESLAAVVTRLDEKPYGERIVYLDNGQVWEEASRNRNLPLAVGDDITVKSAAFGSYKLIGPGGKRFTRVRRIR